MEGRFSMATEPTPVARSVRALPARPSLEHLKNEAKQRLKALRVQNPQAKLTSAQLDVAREYGFASWRKLRAHIDTFAAAQMDHGQVFDAARTGEIEVVRRAFEAGFDPATTDRDGKTVHQIAKTKGHQAIELLARGFQERETRPAEEQQTVDRILDAAEKGDADDLRRLLDAHPDLIDARGGNFQQQTALHKAAWRNNKACVQLLLDRGADVRVRDYGDNAYALHFAAEAADFEIVKMLVEAGSDVIGKGDDHQLGVLGWATSFRRAREDVADYLLAHGAELDFWSAIALDRVEDVERFIMSDRPLLNARMSRNEHHRTPLHQAAAMNRPGVVRLLLDLGADVHATDDTGATPLTTAAQATADPSILSMLQEAGAKLDFLAALSLKRYDVAEAMLHDDPGRIGADGRDTIALHLSVVQKNAESVAWLIAHGVDVNAKRVLWDCNYTALHITAAENGMIDIARMLLDAGADPGIHDDKYDATVLGWAEYCEQPEVAQLLRARGAK
jgi:ankyrin repeat protein